MKISSDISGQPGTAIEGQKQAKLVDAAQQFEATMLQELLKPMQHGQDSWGGEEKSDDSASFTVSRFGSDATAKPICKGGGFGTPKRAVSARMPEPQRDSKNQPSQHESCGMSRRND